jgi:hypothetical protein
MVRLRPTIGERFDHHRRRRRREMSWSRAAKVRAKSTLFDQDIQDTGHSVWLGVRDNFRNWFIREAA